MMKRALITGITGQDGAYLAEHLLAKGYEVHGIKRRMSSFNTWRIDHLYQDRHLGETKLFLHYGDLTDSTNLIRIIKNVEPDEIYNLAAMSHVHVSFEQPEYVANTDGIGTLRLLEAVRLLGMIDKTRIYQASTSELYGKVQDTPQSETTPFYPVSPYAVAKMYAYWITVNYRAAYGMFASNGILFNHESPIRGETFVTRKITRAVAQIALGFEHVLYLGNLNARRDWGHAKEYVEAMHLMLQHDRADDFVIATGKSNSVREFVILAFAEIGLHLHFMGKGTEEQGFVDQIDRATFEAVTGTNPAHIKMGQVLVKVLPEYFRPSEVDTLLGDPRKAKKLLGWEAKVTLGELVSDMVSRDIEWFKRRHVLLEKGYDVGSSEELR